MLDFWAGDCNVIAHGGDGSGAHAFAAATVEGRAAFVIITNGETGWKVIDALISGEKISRLLCA